MLKSAPATTLDDLEFASLISSKICHDVIGPVQAIALSLEVLDDQDDTESRDYAMTVIRNSTETASAKLEFARMAFGAAGSAGAAVDLATAHRLVVGFVGKHKHRMTWSVPPGHMAKDRAKLLLNMVSGAMAALPHGGDIAVEMTGTIEQPTFSVRCSGQGARVPVALHNHLTAAEAQKVDAQTVQAYYAARLARSAGMHFTVAADGPDIVLRASPIPAH
jgi:histidine phosphotransferase ChpT